MLILVINPGSTSTKIAVYEDDKPLFVQTLRHSVEELSKYSKVADQFEFRKGEILNALKNNDVDIKDLKVIMGRGGLCKPISSGVYKVNENMLQDLKEAKNGEHASNLGAMLADQIAREISEMIGDKIPAYIADPVMVDEYEPVARYSGHSLIERKSTFHALNQKAIAKNYAKGIGRQYSDLNLIVVHLGGGVSVGIHKKGKVVDCNNALYGEGPFSPERAGGLPTWGVIDLCFSGKYSKGEVIKLLTGQGGVVSYTGSNSFMDLENNVKKGDQKSIDVLEAFAYQVAKEIGTMATVVSGDVDAILLTGGVAHNDDVVRQITERVKFIAPVRVYPGEDEMGALALNALSVVRGEEQAQDY